MSPRPEEPPAPQFEVPLRLAREGRRDEAVAWIENACRATRAPEAGAGVRADASEAGPDGPPPAADAAAGALARIARMCEQAEDLPGAARALEAAIGLQPGFPDLHYHLARVLLVSGRRAEARDSLDRALRIHPGYVAARVERALLDAREGLIGEALESLRALAAECPIEEPRAFERGLACLEEADWGEAGAFLSRALKLSDPVLEERLERFRGLIEQGQAAAAAGLVRETLTAHPGYPDLFYLLGVAELRQGQVDDAIASLARALELHPDFHAARVELARALAALGQTAESLELLEQVLEVDPGNVEAAELAQRWLERRSARGSMGRSAARPR